MLISDKFTDLRKSSMLINAMQWGVPNHQTPVLIVYEVEMLSKENQLWLRNFIDAGSIAYGYCSPQTILATWMAA